MIITTNPYYLRIFINDADYGHSESYPLVTGDMTTAINYANQLITARKCILPANTQIEWACLAAGGPPFAELALINDPLSALPQWGPYAQSFSGVIYRFDAAAGFWVNRFFKPIDKLFLDGPLAATVPQQLPAGIWPLPDPITLASTTDLFLRCFTAFREQTCKVVPIGEASPGVPLYELKPWIKCGFRKPSARASSHRWRRVSWEAEIFTKSPAFSPCGQAVSVLHGCYSTRCRFYANGTPQRIHYYWAQPAAQVFPLPHIFWGRARAKQISNSTGVGEITGTARRSYSRGFQWGTALGDHYSGTPGDFLGQTNVPWTPETPTPPASRPACDFPRVHPGGLAAGGVTLPLGPLIPEGGLAGGGPSLPLGPTKAAGGRPAGGKGDLIGLLPSRGGLAAGGGESLWGIPKSDGGLAAGGTSPLLGPLVSEGGLAAGGGDDRIGQLPVAGGLNCGGEGEPIGQLVSAGGLGGGGLADRIGQLPSAGGLLLGGKADLVGQLPSRGGLSAGGGTLPLGPLIANGGLAAGGSGDTIGQLPSPGGLAAGGGQDLLGLLPSSGGLTAGGDGDQIGRASCRER